MYEEEKLDFNWLNLFIKVIIFVIFVLLAVWLISKVALRNKNNTTVTATSTMEANLEKMKKTAINYYKEQELPNNTGEKKTLTLQEMIDKKLITKIVDDNKKSCDTKESLAEITRVDTYYVLKVSLTCGEEKDYVYATIGDKNCKICDEKVIAIKEEVTSNTTEVPNSTTPSTNQGNTSTTTSSNNKTNSTTSSNSNKTTSSSSSNKTTSSSSSSSNTSTNNTTNNTSTTTSSNNNTSTIITKKEPTYGEWKEGTRTGSNIENSTKKVQYANYCRVVTEDYYTTSYVNSNTASKTYSYELKLLNVPSSATNVSIKNESYLSTINDYNNYKTYRDQQISMTGNTGTANASITDASKMMSTSLTANNFNFSMSAPYKNGNYYYIKVAIVVNNTRNVKPYQASNLGYGIFFVPAHFQIKYTDKNDCQAMRVSEGMIDNDYVKVGSTYYETINLYRYVYYN